MDAIRRYVESMGFEVRVPRSAYRAPILLCLLEMGSHVHISRVLECVKNRMQNILFDHYHEVLPDGRERWDNDVRFVRNDLAEDGLIARGSRMGIWELTDKGEQEALKHKGE